MLTFELRDGRTLSVTGACIESIENDPSYPNVCTIRTRGGFEHEVKMTFAELSRILAEHPDDRAIGQTERYALKDPIAPPSED